VKNIHTDRLVHSQYLSVWFAKDTIANNWRMAPIPHFRGSELFGYLRSSLRCPSTSFFRPRSCLSNGYPHLPLYRRRPSVTWLKEIFLTFPRQGVEWNRACREEEEKGRGSGLLNHGGRPCRARTEAIEQLGDGPDTTRKWRVMMLGCPSLSSELREKGPRTDKGAVYDNNRRI
jgi:hypothetical protein